MFSSVSCWEIPQARTAARAELSPLGVKPGNHRSLLDHVGGAGEQSR
jgi:hypothetical protein